MKRTNCIRCGKPIETGNNRIAYVASIGKAKAFPDWYCNTCLSKLPELPVITEAVVCKNCGRPIEPCGDGWKHLNALVSCQAKATKAEI